MFKKYLFYIVIFSSIFGYTQSKSGVIFTIDGEPTTTKEFVRVYKKNLDLVKDNEQKDIDNYLKLFIDFKLKIKEAKKQKLNEDPYYLRELGTYKNQLLNTYLAENEATEALVAEAYERSLYNINAAHALVRLDEFDTDTIAAYNKIKDLRAQILANGFEATKTKYHDGEQIFVEDLGYFSVFRMIYEFETVAYNTPVGAVSQPFRTRFGYHVILVKNKERSKGTLTAAHIMIGLKQEKPNVNPQKLINSIYNKLKKGMSFEALAKEFSEDKGSAENGGLLNPFSRGFTGSDVFEDEAFKLENDGDYSKPFKTNFGWHIVKRINLKPLESFEDSKKMLEQRTKQDTRSALINDALVDKIKNNYKITENPQSKNYFIPALQVVIDSNLQTFPEDFKLEGTVFSINNKIYNYKDFADYLLLTKQKFSPNTPAKNIINSAYQSYFNESIIKFRKDNLEFENQEYANTLNEFRDGLLLFEIMEKEVWNKALKDTLALQTYFNNHKEKFIAPQKINLTVAKFSQNKVAKKTHQKLKQVTNKEAFIEILKQNNLPFTEGSFSKNDPIFPKNFNFEKGVSNIYKNKKDFRVFYISEIITEETKSFEDVRGEVISDYQSYLENEWIQNLRKRYKIKVNKKELESLKAELKINLF